VLREPMMGENSQPEPAAGCIRRLGVIGGTFDPPHYAHLVLAETARVQLGLDCVLFVPAGQPPHKSGRPLASAADRAALVEAAIADNPAFRLSRVDLDRPGPHFTVETLALLQAQNPTAELYLLIGGDSLAELHHWRDPAGVVRQARLAVMPRPGWHADMDALERLHPGIGARITWLDAPALDLSSTDLRRRLHAGLPVRYLVPPAVEAYLREHALHMEADR
jgi:nicotinate-nucleotide adenylyltransferase